MSGKRVAAIILNYNDNANTLRLASDLVSTQVVEKIVVVDNSGPNGLVGSENNLNHEKIEFMAIENTGYANGNNRGLQYLESKYGLFDYYVISNPDVLVSGESIAQCVDFLENHQEFAVSAPHMFHSDGTPHHLSGWKERTTLCDLAYSSGILSRTIGMYKETYPTEYWQDDYSVVDCVAGSFFVIKGTIFEKIGYFDKNTFLYYEEDIIGAKLKRLGLKSAILNNCKFIHFEETSVKRTMSSLRKYMNMQKSRLYFHKTYLHVGVFGYIALLAATCLGFTENLVKIILVSVEMRGR